MQESAKGIQQIGERLSKIEREGRRWKLSAIALACVLGVALLTGAQTPPSNNIRAKSFVLVDDSGIPRAELRIHAQDPELVFFQKDGKTIPLALAARTDGPEVVLSSARNAATITVGSRGPEFSLTDSAGFEATIGRIARGRKQDGIETNPSVVSIVISDVRGKILWSAP